MVEENNGLRDQMEWLGQYLSAVPVDTGGNSGPVCSAGDDADAVADHGTEFARCWSQRPGRHDAAPPEESADQVTEEANAEANRMLDQASIHCAQLLSEAQAKAQDMVNEAQTRVETMLHDARATAQSLEWQSRDKAASLEQHATRKHAEILELNQDKSLLEKTIDDLRAFEQEYRSQLTLYLQSLLDKLDGPGSAALVGSELGARGETSQSRPHRDDQPRLSQG